MNRLDEALRLRAFRGELEYSAEIERAFLEALQWWSEPCDHALECLQYFEDQGFVVANAGEFRAACSEVRGMLAGDADFFSGDALANLRDDAKESFRRGECEEMNI